MQKVLDFLAWEFAHQERKWGQGLICDYIITDHALAPFSADKLFSRARAEDFGSRRGPTDEHRSLIRQQCLGRLQADPALKNMSNGLLDHLCPEG
ncbi:MAG: hypothetical protein GY850_15560 [bacterium]|nr:hypothetical protein [bacterium]